MNERFVSLDREPQERVVLIANQNWPRQLRSRRFNGKRDRRQQMESESNSNRMHEKLHRLYFSIRKTNCDRVTIDGGRICATVIA